MRNVGRTRNETVFTAPSERDERVRMRRAHASAARASLVTVSGPEVWGWQGRTLGRRAGTDWLRVVSAPVAKQGGRMWEGTALADALVPRSVPRPRLRDLCDWTGGDHAYRTELTEYVTAPAVTGGSPALDRNPVLPDAWWTDLRSALKTLATVPTDRESVRQRWIDNNFRRFLGIDPLHIRDCTTGHSDVHRANLTCAPLVILDWEGWGRLAVGYDIGLLHAYTLTAPATAARIRRDFADVLDTPAGRASWSRSANSSRRAAGASTPASPRCRPAGPRTSPEPPSPFPDPPAVPSVHPSVTVGVDGADTLLIGER